MGRVKPTVLAAFGGAFPLNRAKIEAAFFALGSRFGE